MVYFKENYNFRRFKVILTFSRGGGLTFSGGVGRGDQIAYSYERSLELVIFKGRGYGSPPHLSGSAHDPFPISFYIQCEENWSGMLKIESRNEMMGERTGTQIFKEAYNIWASTREKLSSGVSEQHRRRLACASAQSDQRLCYSFLGKNLM